MAITETRNLPAQFIEDLGTDYAKQLAATTAAPLATQQFAPAVAAQDPLQQQAATLAGQVAPGGVGAYAPYMTAAETAMGYDPAAGGITAAGYGAALDPYQQVGTPYQQDVLQASLDQFDQQRFLFVSTLSVSPFFDFLVPISPQGQPMTGVLFVLSGISILPA